MSTKLILIAHAGTRLMRMGGFPGPAVGLDEGGLAKANAHRLTGAPPGRIFRGPDAAMAETAQRLRLAADETPALAEASHGAWAGRTFEEVMASDADAFAAWVANPDAGAPGGEPLAAVRQRVGAWMDGQARMDGTVLAITSATVARAAIAHALAIPDAAASRIDVSPLASAELSFNRVWRLQRLAP